MKKLILILAALTCACSWAGVTSARLGALGRNDTVVTNVTDVTPGNYATVSNRAMTASAYTDTALGAFAATGAVRRAEIYGTPTRWTDATGCVWEVTYITNTSASSWIYQTTPQFDVYRNGLDLFWSDGESPFSHIGWWVINGPVYFTNDTRIARLEYDGTYWDEGTGDTRMGHVIATRVSVTNMIGRAAMTNDLPDTASIQSDIADLRTESSLVYRLYSGSNVVAEVTNYNSQVHAPELRLMQLNESNEYVTVWSETNGLARTLARANEYSDAALTNAAPRAWSRTTSGLGADAPSNTTWISTPTTVIAGGLEYAKVVDTYGEVWVLSSNGMAAEFNPDTNAYFRISADDGTPIFSIEKTDAQVVGANAAGITVGETTVTVPVPVVSQDHPSCFWRYALDDVGWGDEASAPQTWDFNWTGGTGAWVLTLNFNGTRPPSLFLRFSFLQEGGVVIRNRATTDISAGIWVNGVKFVPSVSGNNLIWTKQ